MQSKKLKLLIDKRDNEKVQSSLNRIRACAKGTENLMPAVIEAVENYCTLGEIADELRAVFGEYK